MSPRDFIDLVKEVVDRHRLRVQMRANLWEGRLTCAPAFAVDAHQPAKRLEQQLVAGPVAERAGERPTWRRGGRNQCSSRGGAVGNIPDITMKPGVRLKRSHHRRIAGNSWREMPPSSDSMT